ncbi:hypothetical protein D9M71_277870 [compost metagenome]
MQPLDPVQGDVVLLLMAAGVHPHAHVVAGVGPQHRREGVTRHVASVVDVRREAGAGAGRPGSRADGAGCQVQRRDGPVGAGLQGIGEVAGQAVGLHAGFAVRSQLVRVEHAQGHRLVAVVDDEHARIVCADRLRAGPARAAEDRTGRFHRRFQFVGDERPYRRVHGKAEAVRGQREGVRVGYAVGAGADIYAGLVGMLHIAEFQEELAEAVVLAIAIQVTGGDHRLPGSRAAILPATAERLAGFGVIPG